MITFAFINQSVMELFKKSVILIVFSLLALLSSCRSKPEKHEQLSLPVNVRVHTVSETTLGSEREYVGVLEESNNVLLSFPAPGKIKNVYVTEGQAVREGQLLAQIDAGLLENMHATTAATLRQAEDAYQRMTLLYESQSLPEIQYVDIQTKLEQARSAERISAMALAETKLIAPQRGVVGKRMMEPGMNVLPDQPLLILLNTHNPVVKVSVPENEIFDTRTGQEARIVVGALRNLELEGKVTEKGVQAHPYTHGYEVRISLDREVPGLLPGMVCKVFLRNLPTEVALVVPVRAVLPLEFGKGHFVWLLDQDNVAQRRMVQVGEIVPGGISVLKGITPGDRIVVEGYQRLSENIKVTVTNE